MKQLETYLSFIETELNQLDLPSSPKNLYDPIHYFMKIGGKRIRPILTLLAAEYFGETKENALPAAIAVELFHNFSLMHDDIMDVAPIRRGKATIHEKWNTNIAILSGDVLFVKAYQQLAKQSQEQLYDLINLFNKTAIEVCEGQQMDMDFEQQTAVSTEEYIEMIRLKTSVLLGCALQFGAIIAGASKHNQALIYQYGINLGIAFQIQDDLLDLYGKQEQVGKQIGGDIIANKKTLLCILADELADEPNKHRLAEMYAEKDHSTKILLARHIFENLGVYEHCHKQKEIYYLKAMEALETIDYSPNKSLLVSLSDYLFNREY